MNGLFCLGANRLSTRGILGTKTAKKQRELFKTGGGFCLQPRGLQSAKSAEKPITARQKNGVGFSEIALKKGGKKIFKRP